MFIWLYKHYKHTQLSNLIVDHIQHLIYNFLNCHLCCSPIHYSAEDKKRFSKYTQNNIVYMYNYVRTFNNQNLKCNG